MGEETCMGPQIKNKSSSAVIQTQPYETSHLEVNKFKSAIQVVKRLKEI